MKTYCAFSGTSTNLCSVWDYHLLPEILLQETSSRTQNVKYLNELFLSAVDFMKYCAIRKTNVVAKSLRLKHVLIS